MARVLIIDRDAYTTSLLKAQLGMQGDEVIVTHRGDDGLAKAVESKPDLIILDAILPDATGFQLCNQLRKTKETESTPIFMLSSLAQYPNQQQYATQRGVTEFINKPFEVI